MNAYDDGMAESLNEPAEVYLPGQFTGRAMSYLAGDVAKYVVGGQWPERVTFDFSRLRFIRPAGVVFLRNVIRWLHEEGCKVFFRGHNGESAPVKYLRDAQFFRLHLEGEYE
jgi:hypothetical protein